MAFSRRSFLLATAAGLLGPSLARAQGDEAQRPPVAASPPATDGARAIAAAINAFGSRAFAQLLAQEPGDVTMSPFSLVSALSMLTFGARGQTRHELESALGFGNQSDEALTAAFEALGRGLAEQSSEATRLRVANALWTRAPAASEAGPVLQRAFGADLNAIDFSSPGAVRQINDWVARATEEAIDRIIEGLDADTAFVLTNATYFKGRWASEFRTAATQQQPFLAASGTERAVPMMQQRLATGYAAHDGLHAVRLPYAGDNLALVVVTAQARQDHRRLAGALDQEGLARTFALFRFEPRSVALRLPRFKTETGGDLSELLVALGLGPAFRRGADFSALAPGENAGMRVVQRAVIDVNEEGTTAAAATGVAVRTSSIVLRPANFDADRPFAYALVDARTGLHLFSGIVRV